MKYSLPRWLVGWLVGAALACGLSAALAPRLAAQTPAPSIVPVALTPLQRDTPVELTALTLDADVSEVNGHTIVTGNSTFKLHNTDRANDLQVAVGLPTWAGDPYAFDPARLEPLSVSVDGVKVKALTPGKAELKIGSTVRAVDWYTFTVAIPSDDKKTVRLDFQQDLGDGALARFTYGMLPAVNWKGSIGSARLTVRFPANTTLDQVVESDPTNPEFDGQSLTWRFTTKEPPTNPTLTILRPSVWNDLQAKRRAAQANPNDANARLALGELLRQLAQFSSARRDSFALQAIAELETAVRLNPNSRNARQALATLYEARAGAATGPRNVAYVQLAVAQWEPLQNDAAARKQLAEDYFYLGLDAQTRHAYADALTWFDKANVLAPNGAGPLFLPERMTAQRRALNFAWARALLEQGDAANALPKARAALSNTFFTAYNPPPFYVTRAQVTTATQVRTLTFTLAPLLSAETQNAASGVVATWRAAGNDATLDVEPTNIVIAVPIPFTSSAELRARLTTLAQALPERAEWSLVRAVFAANDLVWEQTDDLIARGVRYQENVDLSRACAAFTAQLDAVAQNAKPYENIAASDEEAQLKRALWQYAQSGWQAALANGRVTYRAGIEEARVETCGARALTWNSSEWQIERVGIVAGILLALVVLGAILIVRRK